ncbi:MAG: hypothetical protein ACR2OZ_07455 [Verrucomicrobiales bacterium]
MWQAAMYFQNVLQARGGAGHDILFNHYFTSSPDDAALANVGQLKWAAAPFYRRLHDLGLDVRPGLLAHVASSEVTAFSQQLDQQAPPRLPWNPAAPPGENSAPATVGQLKLAFCFDLDVPLAFDQTDANSNGIADGQERWENAYQEPLPAAEAGFSTSDEPTYRLDDFSTLIEVEETTKHILCWNGEVNKLYRVERSDDLGTWETEASFFTWTAVAPESPAEAQRLFRYHFLTVDLTQPPTNQFPPSKPAVLFALRRIGDPAQNNWLATWTGIDGMQYAAEPVGPPSDTFPPETRESNGYQVSVFQLPLAHGAISIPITPDLPAEEAARLTALNLIIPTLGQESTSSAALPVAGSQRFWRVREIVDSDGDGISDSDEILVYHTDPFLSDSDGDGTFDGAEIADGRSPLDPGDSEPTNFVLNWQAFRVMTVPVTGYESGWSNRPLLAKYRKRITTTEQAEYYGPTGAAALFQRDDIYDRIVEEHLNGGQLTYNSRYYVPRIRWDYVFTQGSPIPATGSSGNSQLFNLQSPSGGRVTGWRTYITTRVPPYEGWWEYGTAQHTSEFDGTDEWQWHAEVNWQQQNWTATSSSNVTRSTLESEIQSAPSYTYLPTLVWEREDFARAGNSNPDTPWRTVELFDKITYNQHRDNVFALNYAGAPIGILDNDDLLSPGTDPSGSANAHFVQDPSGWISLREYRFKFRREGNATGATIVRWIETFYPADDPSTVGDESLNEPESKDFFWTAERAAAESPTFTIDPSKGTFSDGVGPAKDGTTVVNPDHFDLDVDTDMNGTISQADETLEDASARGVIIDVNNNNTDYNQAASSTKDTVDNANDRLDTAQDRAEMDDPFASNGHRFGRLDVETINVPGYEYWLVALDGAENRVRVFDERLVSADQTKPEAWIGPGVAERQIPYVILFPNPTERYTRLHWLVEGISYGPARLELQVRKSGNVRFRDTVKLIVNVDQYAHSNPATTNKAFSLSGIANAESESTGKNPNYTGLRFTPDLANLVEDPSAHIVALRARLKARIPSFVPSGSTRAQAQFTWRTGGRMRHLQSSSFWIGLRGQGGNSPFWVQTGLYFAQDSDYERSSPVCAYLEDGAEHPARGAVAHRFRACESTSPQVANITLPNQKALQQWQDRGLVLDLILFKAISNESGPDAHHWHVCYRDGRRPDGSFAAWSDKVASDRYFHLQIGAPRVVDNSEGTINDQLRTIFETAACREIEIEFETTQSISFAPGYAGKEASMEGMQLATRRDGTSQPAGTSAADWFHWAAGNSTPSQAAFNWNFTGTPTGSKVRVRNGAANSASDESPTTVGAWHVNVEANNGTGSEKVLIWDDRRWGFADKQ